MAHKPWITAWFREHGKQNFVQPSNTVLTRCRWSMCWHPFLRSWKLLRLHTHAWTKMKSWAESLVLIMYGPYLKQTQLLCVNFSVCEQPALVCHGLQLPCVKPSSLWVSLMLTLRSGSSLSLTAG